MPDNLTTRLKEELKRRGTIVSDSQVELFLKSRGINPASTSVPQQATNLASRGIRMAAEPKVATSDNAFDLVGSALWHAFDTAAFGVPGIALG